jgi:ribosomal protein S27AE
MDIDPTIIVALLFVVAFVAGFGALRNYEVNNIHPQSRVCPHCGQVRAHAKFGRYYCPHCHREV